MKAYYLYFFLFLILFSFSCEKEKSIDELIEEKVAKKILEFRKKKLDDCWRYIHFKAEEYVDSVMYLEIGSTIGEPFDLPERPQRPQDSLVYHFDLDTSELEENWVDTSYIK